MDIIEKFDAQIDAYILDSLSAADKQAFEQALSTSQELKDELAMRKSLNLGLEQIELKDVRNRLDKIKNTKSAQSNSTTPSAIIKQSENNIQTNTTKSNNWPKYLLLLASLAALLFFASKFLSPTPEETKTNIPMASYFEPMPLQISDRGDMADDIKEMTALYNNKEYAKVTPYLDTFLENGQDVKWNLYRGITHYKTGAFAKALLDFKTVANSDNYLLSDHGKWYQALTAIELGDKDSAKTLLQSLASKANADHSKEAKELLNKL